LLYFGIIETILLALHAVSGRAFHARVAATGVEMHDHPGPSPSVARRVTGTSD